jgi:predicted O-methyltransferase YrrM
LPERLLDNPELLGMGHHERVADANLGLGHLYYALARVVRPGQVVVIGSWRGFVPLVLAQGVAANLEPADITFIDPSLVDGFWRDPVAVEAHFARYTPQKIRHHLLTTQQFVDTPAYAALTGIGLLFIDGYHSHEQAKFDFEAFVPKLADNAVVLFHDSIRVRVSRIYGEDKAFEHRVKCYMNELKADPQWQVFDLPFGDGVSLVRRNR